MKGSSKMISRGSMAMIAIMQTQCFWPCDKALKLADAQCDLPNSLRVNSVRLAASSFDRPCYRNPNEISSSTVGKMI